MARAREAAVGFRVHSGWAAVVVVWLEKGAPVVLERKRAHLVKNVQLHVPAAVSHGGENAAC